MKIKKIVAVLAVGVMVLAFNCVAFAASITIDADEVEIAQGTTEVSVPVYVTDNPGIASLGFNVAYDSSAMTLTSVDAGELFTTDEITTGDLTKNPYMVSCNKLANVTNTGVVVTLKFTAKVDCPIGEYAITLGDGGNLGGALNITFECFDMILQNGSVKVSSKNISESTDESAFEFDSSTGAITGYTGSDTEVIIPSTINGEAVKMIGSNSFKGNTSITSVVIPEGVTIINSAAFQDCSSLTEINIPAKVISIGNSAFYGCSSLKSVEIPEGVTIINSAVFRDCSSLTSVSLPESLTSIETSGFRNCSKLTEINIPAKVTSIGNSVFYGCSSLKSVEIPEGVTKINPAVFRDCSSLTSVSLPESLTSIEINGFRNCSKLTEINIPAKVTSIGNSAFYGCSSIKSVEIPNGVTTIDSSAFRECSSLTSVSLPSTVESMGENIFVNSENVVLCIDGSNEIANEYALANNLPYVDVSSVEIACNVESGTYNLTEDNDIITINSNNDKVSIYYTLDGSEPDNNSMLYSEGISATEGNMTLKYVAYVGGLAISPVYNREYTFIKSVPVVKNIVGDNNSDGLVTIADLTRLEKYITNQGNSLNMTEAEIKACDVNGDGYVNIKDALKLSRYLSGWDNIILGE